MTKTRWIAVTLAALMILNCTGALADEKWETNKCISKTGGSSVGKATLIGKDQYAKLLHIEINQYYCLTAPANGNYYISLKAIFRHTQSQLRLLNEAGEDIMEAYVFSDSSNNTPLSLQVKKDKKYSLDTST